MAKAKLHQAREDQQYIDGIGPTKNNRVHAAAKRYATLRDARIAANKEEKESHDTLLGTMMEEGLEVYDFKDVHVAIDATKKCKVSIGGEAIKDKNGEETDEE